MSSGFIDGIFGEFLPGLQKTLTLNHRRNEALVSNITNAETPGYRAVDLNFAGELQRAFNQDHSVMKKTSEKHLDLESESNAHLQQDLSGATKPDGNNVDVDIQMARLSQNAGRYILAARLVRNRMRNLKETIRLSMR